MFFPATDVEIVDTWHSSGLRGTGSNDFAVAELFVPAGRAVAIVGARPRIDRPLYVFPLFSMLALAVASVCLGIARRAIDELVDLAEVKTPVFTSRRLERSTMTQVDVAKAEAALGSARAFLLDEVGATWDDVLAGREVSLDQRARVRLAATNAGVRCAEAVDFAYNAGGGSSVFAKSPLQRCFRDIHTATQHIMVQPARLRSLRPVAARSSGRHVDALAADRQKMVNTVVLVVDVVAVGVQRSKRAGAARGADVARGVDRRDDHGDHGAGRLVVGRRRAR